jgi:hypothetical protein
VLRFYEKKQFPKQSILRREREKLKNKKFIMTYIEQLAPLLKMGDRRQIAKNYAIRSWLSGTLAWWFV